MSVKQILILCRILSPGQRYCLEKTKPNQWSWDTVERCGYNGRTCRTMNSPCHNHRATNKPSFTQEAFAESHREARYTQG